MTHLLRKLLPEIIVLIVLSYLMIAVHWAKPNSEGYIVQSDGRGYYAFLPAVFIQKDMSFASTMKEEGMEGHYLIKTADGKSINKYYPGVAVLQLPFFTAAYLFSPDKSTITGYSTLFMRFFHVGSLIYGLLGFYFLRKYLSLTGIRPRSALITSFVVFFGTMVFYQIVFSPSLSHHYSFFLFACFAYLVKKYQQSQTLKTALLAGLVIGLIFLVRPVNILIVASIPYLIGNKKDTLLFLKSLFNIKNKHLLVISSFFFLALIPLFALSYAETGQLLNWSYQGEGFNFTNPQLWEVLFGFRTGFFTHTPTAFLGLIGVLVLFKRDTFIGFSWLIYFFLVSYITASWWSWDFGGYFGNRTYTEHLVLFAFPIAHLLDQKKFAIISYPSAALLSIFMMSRAYQYYTDILPNRFTPSTYFKSIALFDSSHKDDFGFSREVKPFGRISRTWHLTTDTQAPIEIDGNRQFAFTTKFNLPEDSDGKCYYFTLEVDKRLAENSDFKGVSFVIDAHDSLSDARDYASYSLYDYYREATNETMQYTLEQAYCGNGWRPYNTFSLYIYNSQLKHFYIEDFHLKVEEFVVR